MAGRIDLSEAPYGANSENSDHRESVTGFKRSRKKQGPALSMSLPVVNFPPLDQRPCFSIYETAFQNHGREYRPGVYDHGTTKETDELTGATEKVPYDTWICSVLKVLHIVRTESGKEHGYRIEYVEHGKTTLQRETLLQSSLLGRADEAQKTLRGLGVSVLRGNSKKVLDYLDREHLRFSGEKPEDFWRSVKTVGWSPAPDCFVLPNELIGRQAGVCFVGHGDVAEYGTSGGLAEWKAHVAVPCVGNPYLIVALSCAFAGPLLELLNIPGLGLHYYGDSTTGKTSSLNVACSVWGPPKFMLTWRNTVNGLESKLESRSSTLTLLDESNQMSPKDIDPAIYMLLNGQAKGRMTKEIRAKENALWRLCLLSSGERSLRSNLESDSISHKAGQGVRINDVPMVAQYGAFDDLHDSLNGSVFSDRLRNAAAKYYGHAGPEFVGSLIKNLPGLTPPLPTRLAEILEVFGDLNAQEKWVARSFAIVALAGELAIEWGVLPWEKGAAQDAAVKIFNHWRDSQPKSSKSREHAQILERISDFIDKHGAARFSNINWTPGPNRFGGFDDQPIIRDQAGFWEDSDDGSRIYLFTSGGTQGSDKGFRLRPSAQSFRRSRSVY